MFHSVGNDRSEWNRNHLSISKEHFEYFCKYLDRENYKTLLLEEWYGLQNSSQNIYGKYIILTFDDGYLDNWVFVYPILKKYGLKGTIFINPEFVDTCNELRFNLEDAWSGKITENKLNTLGFLSWPEIIKMDSDGILQAQSHSMTHNWYFKSNRIIDIYLGQSKYDWLAWVQKPERKPFYITEDQKELVALGYPVFEHDRALAVRRYFPDQIIIDKSIELSKDLTHNGSVEQKSKIIGELNSMLEKYPGRYETDEEMKNRYRYELFESKKFLEEKLNKPVDFLCWPGGGYNEISQQIAKEAGYKSSTIASWDKNHYVDNSGFYKRISRFGMGSFVYKKNRKKVSILPNHLVLSYKAKTGRFFPKVVLKLQKIFI